MMMGTGVQIVAYRSESVDRRRRWGALMAVDSPRAAEAGIFPSPSWALWTAGDEDK